MAYIAPIHRASRVRYALLTHLISAEEESLVLAKHNRLEVWQLSQGTLVLAHSKVINGTISIVQKLRPKDSRTDLLFVGTERFEYMTLAWNPETQQLDLMDSFKDPGQEHMRGAQSQNRCLVDPSGRYIAMHLWEGVLTLLRLGNRKNKAMTLEWMDQVRLSELFIKASTFLFTETGHPKIAFLYQSQADSTDSKLAAYRLTSDDRGFNASRFDPERDREIESDIADANAAMLIPVRKVGEEVKRHNVRNLESAKAHMGGLLVVGETRLLYIDEVTQMTVESAIKEPSIFVAWAEYSPVNYFLADDYGRMHLLTILTEGAVVTGMEISKIGKTTRAAHLVYLGNNVLFVASESGDSQLFHLDLQNRDPEKKIMTLVQSLSNIGPIMDMAIMDLGNRGDENQTSNEYSSGQARIVTGSGVHNDGSLRSVRSGVGLEDIGILAELEHTRGLFPVKSYGANKVDTLIVSFLTETRVFRFDAEGEVEELESFAGMTLDRQTWLVSNLPNGLLLQVTTAGVTISDLESRVTTSSWAPEDGKNITNASANDESLLLAVGGTQLVSLSLVDSLRVVREKALGSADQIACLHVASQLSNVGVVGFWASGTVSIIDLSTLEPVHGESLRTSVDDASVPRDLFLAQVLPPEAGGQTLFIAMEDGNVVTFDVSSDLVLSGRKRVVLGTRAAKLHPLRQENGLFSIFATTEHPSLIFSAERRIVYSAARAEDATYVCRFDSEAFPGAIVIATESQIKISNIDLERRTHVRTLPMGEMVRRLTYSPNEKVFGLGCIHRELVGGEEMIQSSFKLVDEVIFDKVGKPFQLGKPSLTELVESVVRAELPDSYGKLVDRFIVGTSYIADPDFAANPKSGGRILVFGVDSERDPYVILSHELKGACRSLAVMDGKIVAALTKTVVVCRYEETSTTTAQLTMLASYRPSTYPVDVAVHGNMIGVADLMKSVTLVEFVPAGPKQPTAKLMERARHYQSAWATAVTHVEGNLWLEADAQGNLMVLRQNTDGVTDENKARLEITSEINLGEMVNRIRTISVDSSPNAMVIPRAFLATVEGGIYLFGTVAPHAQDVLFRFQTKLASVVKTTGHLDFHAYRSFMNPEREGDGPFRSLDGELLERFLELDDEIQADICHGLGPSVEDLRNMVEELRRMH